MSDDEIEEAKNEGRNIITEPWQESFFEHKYDFKTNTWVEGLTPEEVAQRHKALEEFNNRIPDEEMNAIAIMELSQIVLSKEVK